MPSRLDKLSPLALTSRAGRRLTALLVGMLTLAGIAAGMATLVRPAPQPHFVGAWLLGSPASWSLWETTSHRGQEALTASGAFEHWQVLPSPAPTRQQLRDHVEQLTQLQADQPIVLCLTARATLGDDGSVQLLLGGEHSSETYALSDILGRLADCRSQYKWLVLDLASIELAPWSATAAGLSTQVEHELQATADSNRIVLSNIGRPMASETWQRTPMGYYLEQALSGAADGWLDGKSDGRVTAREASRYMARHVQHWSAAITGREHAPTLSGDGSDFDLVAYSLSGNPVHSASSNEATSEYPTWLTKAWQQHDQLWNRSARELRPRLYRRSCYALLRAEQQWRGGRDPQLAERDLNYQFQQQRASLAKSQAKVASPAGYSVFMFRDEAFRRQIDAATSAFDSLLVDLNTQSAGLPTEEVAAVRQALSAEFAKQTNKLPAAAVAAGAVEHLTSTNSPSAEEVMLLNRLVRKRQPQPIYTETLLLNRLAQLAERQPAEFPSEAIAPLLRIARQSSRCMSATPAWHWTSEPLSAAAQSQYNAEYLLLRPGYAPPELAEQQLAHARQAYRQVESAGQSITAAYHTLDDAMRTLPALPQQLGSEHIDRQAWQAAQRTTAELANLLAIDNGKPTARTEDLKADVARLQWAARAVDEQLTLLRRALSDDRLVHLLLASEEQESTAEQLAELTSLLRASCWSASQREQLVEAHRTLSTRLHNQLADTRPSWTDRLPQHATKQRQLPAMIDAQQQLPGLDDPLTSTAVELRKQTVEQRNAWLAQWFTYKAIDDTPRLNTQLARRYRVDTREEPVAQLHFTGESTLTRPMRHRPQSTATVGVKLLMPDSIANYRAHSPTDALSIDTTQSIDNTEASFELTVQRLAERSDNQSQRGVLLEVEALGHTWHRPLRFARPSGPALELLLAPTNDAGQASTGPLTLRPTTGPQMQFLFVANHSEQTFDGVIEIEGVGQATVHAAAGQIVPLHFQAVAEADPAKLPRFTESVSIRIRSAAEPDVLRTQVIPLRILSPQQYVRVVESRFIPAANGSNMLRVALAANDLPAGPPCRVSLQLTADRVPGLQGVTGGSRQGLLPTDGTPVVLTAEGLLLSERTRQQAEFSLSVDRVAEAITLEGVFPQRGDPTSPRQLVDSRVTIIGPEYVRSGSNFQPQVSARNAPAEARLRVRIGQLRGTELFSELEQTAPHVHWNQVQVTPQKNGSLACQVTQANWPFALDTRGIVGRRVVQAELLDQHGQVLATDRTRVTFDDTAPERVSFCLPPEEALVGAPFSLSASAADAVSGIEHVFLFVGRPVDDQPPAEARRIEASWNAHSSLWEAQLPPVKQAGPLHVTAQAVNRVGMSSFVSTPIRMATELEVPGGEIRGRVSEGPRMQPQLQVQLLDATGGPIATAQTNSQGQFSFAELPPGEYQLTTEKPASGRSAKQGLTLKSAQVAVVHLELTL